MTFLDDKKSTASSSTKYSESGNTQANRATGNIVDRPNQTKDDWNISYAKGAIVGAVMLATGSAGAMFGETPAYESENGQYSHPRFFLNHVAHAGIKNEDISNIPKQQEPVIQEDSVGSTSSIMKNMRASHSLIELVSIAEDGLRISSSHSKISSVKKKNIEAFIVDLKVSPIMHWEDECQYFPKQVLCLLLRDIEY